MFIKVVLLEVQIISQICTLLYVSVKKIRRKLVNILMDTII